MKRKPDNQQNLSKLARRIARTGRDRRARKDLIATIVIIREEIPKLTTGDDDELSKTKRPNQHSARRRTHGSSQRPTLFP